MKFSRVALTVTVAAVVLCATGTVAFAEVPRAASAEAHAVLDAARAAQQLPDTKIGSDGPVGQWGYSQGGGAAAAAAELAGSYTPELDVAPQVAN